MWDMYVQEELSCLLKNYLDVNSENKFFAQIMERGRTVGLVVPVKFSPLTAKLCFITRNLERELGERTLKYTTLPSNSMTLYQ